MNKTLILTAMLLAPIGAVFVAPTVTAHACFYTQAPEQCYTNGEPCPDRSEVLHYHAPANNSYDYDCLSGGHLDLPLPSEPLLLMDYFRAQALGVHII